MLHQRRYCQYKSVRTKVIINDVLKQNLSFKTDFCSGIAGKVDTNLDTYSLPRMVELYQYHVMMESKLDPKCLLLAWLYNLEEFHGKAELSGGAAFSLSQKPETFNPTEGDK